jgi:hypothetical protein
MQIDKKQRCSQVRPEYAVSSNSVASRHNKECGDVFMQQSVNRLRQTKLNDKCLLIIFDETNKRLHGCKSKK